MFCLEDNRVSEEAKNKCAGLAKHVTGFKFNCAL